MRPARPRPVLARLCCVLLLATSACQSARNSFPLLSGNGGGSPEALEQAWKADPGDSAAGRRYAEALRRKGQMTEAVAVITELTRRHPEDASLTVVLGKLLTEAGRGSEAIAPLTAATAAPGADWTVWSALGTAQHRRCPALGRTVADQDNGRRATRRGRACSRTADHADPHQAA